MATLRVLLDAAPAAGRADAWVLFDENERIVQSGRSAPDAWPAAERKEAVLAAACVRIVGLRLPPLSVDRVGAAASFALEDQLAGPADEQQIAVSPQRPDGSVEAIVANRRLVASLANHFDRVLAEPALAPRPPQQYWCWYASGAGGGFVRKPDGSAFAISENEGVPAELTLAVDHASREGNGPVGVETAFAADDTTRAAFAQQLGTALVPTAAWRWDASGSAAFAAATDVRQGEFARAATGAVRASTRLFRWATALAALAVGVHIAGSIGEWLSLRVGDWRARTSLASLARDAGVSSVDDPAKAIAKRYAEARHRAGLAAPADALPLLARAAPTLAALPAGVLKSATYADGHWTFDLAKLDVSVAARLERQLASAGLTTMQATNASGARMRVSLGKGVQ
jgi:Type II secretion system (T2SS), protein L